MKFSILIAHYNNWLYLQDCLKSIENQTYKNYEIIIVDDCSTDDSFEFLRAISTKNSNIKLFQNECNKKVGFTKKRCVDEASGDVCIFVDPDDMITSTTLEEILNIYIESDQYIATYSKIKLIDENKSILGDFKHSKKITNNKSNFFNINFEVAHLFSFKRESYLQTSGIDGSLSSAVDQDLYLKLYEVGDFYFINKFQYYYRIHDKGVSQNVSRKKELYINWHKVLTETCKRRNIKEIYGKQIAEVDDLPTFIYTNENNLLKRLFNKISIA